MIDFDKVLAPILQSKIVFINKDKTIKSGKFVLFKLKEFYIDFYIYDKKDKLKEVFIPYPFDIQQIDDNSILLDYRLNKFVNENSVFFYKAKIVNSSKKNKFFNSVVVLSANQAILN